MLTSNVSPSYTTEYSISSIESNDNEVSLTVSSNRLCGKIAPTLETGRRSQYLVLVGEEAIRRDKRRKRNREAARKLKEKRQLIEEELMQKLVELEGEHSDLQNYLQQLREKKQNLQEELNKLFINPIDEFLTNNNQDIPLYFDKYLNDLDIFDETIENILNFDFNTSINSLTYN